MAEENKRFENKNINEKKGDQDLKKDENLKQDREHMTEIGKKDEEDTDVDVGQENKQHPNQGQDQGQDVKK